MDPWCLGESPQSWSVAEAVLPLLVLKDALVSQSGLATLGPDTLSKQESFGLTQVLDEKAFTAPNTS